MTLLFCLVVVGVCSGQKIGHVFYNELLVNAPGIKAIDAYLTSFQDSVTQEFRKKEQELFTKYKPLLEQADQGLLAPKDMAQIQKEYDREEQKLLAFGKSLDDEILSMRQHLILPVIQRVNRAIDLVAQELGYSLIVDSGLGASTYYPFADDLYDEIIQKLKEME